MAMFLNRLKRKTTSEIERLIIQKVYLEYMISEELPKQSERFTILQRIQCQSACEFYFHVMTEKGYPEELKKNALNRVERDFLALERELAETSSSEEETEDLNSGVPPDILQEIKEKVVNLPSPNSGEVER